MRGAILPLLHTSSYRGDWLRTGATLPLPYHVSHAELCSTPLIPTRVRSHEAVSFVFLKWGIVFRHVIQFNASQVKIETIEKSEIIGSFRGCSSGTRLILRHVEAVFSMSALNFF
jgi:hypothetical protein